MAHDITLFWLVLGGLLCIDNLVLVPAGGDHLRFGRDGRLRYAPGPRLQALRRDLVLLNPLDPFDRVALTRRCIGPLTAGQWRSSLRLVRDALGAANRLSMLGSGYLLILVLLCVASRSWYFGTVLLILAGVHLSAWLLALCLLLRQRNTLGLSGSRISALALEALLVPGYLVNLGKRVWLKHQLELPGLTLGLRELKRMPAGEPRTLYHLRLGQRLDDVAFVLGLNDAPAGDAKPREIPGNWLEEARRCLTTSAPAAGS